MNSMFITVVMPVRNEEEFIEKTISQLLTQDYPDDCFEIIVADGMSDDNTREIINRISQEHPQVKLFNNPGKLSSSGRNVGFKNGKGDVFLVVDGHCYIPSNKLFYNIAQNFEKSGADCLCRPQPLDPPDISPFQKAVALVRKSFIGHGRGSYIYSDYEGYVSPVSHGAIYARHVFHKTGLVDENFDACEDVEFNYRVEQAGLKSFMSPDLTVKYYPRNSLGSLFKQAKRYGQGRFRFLEKHPSSFSISSIVPFLFLAYLLLFSTLSFFYYHFVILVSGPLCLYLFVIIMSSIINSSKKDLKQIFDMICIYTALHFGLGWGFMKELIQFIKRKYLKYQK